MTKQGMLSYEQENRLLAKKGLTTYCVWGIIQAERSKKETKRKDVGGLRND